MNIIRIIMIMLMEFSNDINVSDKQKVEDKK